MVCMSMTRRSLVVGGASLAAASRVHGFAQAGGALTAGEVVERIKSRVGIPWMTETVDRIVAGSPEVRVKGIATTMMATLEVIQRAVAAGRNMIVTHEPTPPWPTREPEGVAIARRCSGPWSVKRS